ncbi:hypothetical protein N9V00_01175 [Bacteroidota bacterium]|jgi:transcription elongation factor GreA-like protein|nr:hypothetical protein [Bacteroidota bacterium]|tara:strand:- start:1872 stop:2603 length:732 start_codon:yes stop_codon:yes gene_type:complete
MKILVIGYGEIAEEFAKVNRGVEILGIRRNKGTKLSNVKIIHQDYSVKIPEVAKNLSPDWVLFFPKTRDNDIESYKEGFLSQLDRIFNMFQTSKKIFFSSTRVLSGYINVEIDETFNTKPTDPQGKVIAEYERIIQQQQSAYILRLSGLITSTSNFVELVVKKNLFSENKHINAIHISDVVKIITSMIEGNKKEKLINCVMPVSAKYSELFPKFKGETVNAKIKSIHYNNPENFNFNSIKEII